MPLIQANMIEQVLTPAQIKEISAMLKNAMGASKDEALPSSNPAIPEEIHCGEWDGGEPALATKKDVRAPAAGKKWIPNQ